MGLGHNVAEYVEKLVPGAIVLTKNTKDLITFTNPNVLAIEMNIIAHEVPSYVNTGDKLYSWFVMMIDQYLIGPDIDTIIFVADNYERVPVEKHVVHTQRGDTEAVYAAISADYCPPNQIINANSDILFNVICYLLERTIENAGDGSPIMYATCPSRKRGAVGDSVLLAGTQYAAGTNIKSTPPRPLNIQTLTISCKYGGTQWILRRSSRTEKANSSHGCGQHGVISLGQRCGFYCGPSTRIT